MDQQQPPTIRRAGAEDAEILVHCIALAFAEDPIMRYLYPASDGYWQTMPAFTRAFSGSAMEAGACWLEQHGAGAACWLMPHQVQADMPPTLFSDVDPERLAEVGGMLEAIAALHPAEPHWYLPQIGVDPVARGQGVGAALMKTALRAIDESRAPAFLESSNPRNVSLYERFGFEVIAELQYGNAPPMIPMVRSPA
ncbi:MAG: GNAT family N-acetyltransferase [Pseudomonadota bacterium]